MDRWRYSLLSVVATVVGYGLYALVAVPFIEPSWQRNEAKAAAQQKPRNLAAVVNPVVTLRERLRIWFPAEAWEVTDASKIIETEQGILVLRHYRNNPDGTVRLWPCTMIMLPDGAHAPGRQHEAIVMKASEGAVLRFDSPIDLSGGTLGKLLGGQLQGPVQIDSGMRDPLPEDDLHIVTRDVELTGTTIKTLADVEFRVGRNQGRGRELNVELIPAPVSKGGQPSFTGLRSLTLQRDIQMQLFTGDKLLGESSPKTTTALPTHTGNKPPKIEYPLFILCGGPFKFDAEQLRASFSRAVVVERANPVGEPDQLLCDQLDLQFMQRGADPTATASLTPAGAEPAKKSSQALNKLQFQRLEAQGQQVLVLMPQRDVHITCQALRWDDASGWLSLRMQPPLVDPNIAARQPLVPPRARVVQREHFFEAPEIHVNFDRINKRLQQAIAIGAGELQAQQIEQAPLGAQPAEGERTLRARWQNRFDLQPEGELQRMTLDGEAEVLSAASGKLLADRLEVWLSALPKMPEEKGRASTSAQTPGAGTEPRRVLATGHVRLASPTMTARLDRLELEILYPPPVPVAVAPQAGGPALNGTQPPPPAPPPEKKKSTEPDKVMDFTCRQLYARVLMRDRKPELIGARGEGDIQVREQLAVNAPVEPLTLFGDVVEAEAPTPETMQVRLTGQPARATAQGLQLQGSTINLHRGENRLWIDGAGYLGMQLKQDANGKQLATPQMLDVHWQGGMEFNGERAIFRKQVEAEFDKQQLHTDILDVWLTKRIDFANARSAGPTTRPEVARISCPGEFYLHSQTGTGMQLTSAERLEARRLIWDQRSGDVRADGPGWLVQVRQGEVADLTSPGSQKPLNRPADQKHPSDRLGLNYLEVRFEQMVEGNVQQKQMRFVGEVETVYGPVDAWDERLDAEHLGPQGAWLRCDQLMLRRLETATGPQNELEALQNIQIEGREFTARGSRMTYAQAKDYLILEGDARNEAQLVRQPRPGGAESTLTARKIHFWRRMDRVKLEDVRGLDLGEIR